MVFKNFIANSSDRFKKFVYDMHNKTLNPQCLLCYAASERNENLCLHCERLLPILPDSCKQCGKFYVAPSLSCCGECLKNPPPMQRVYSLFPYQAPIISLLHQLKFNAQIRNAKIFSDLFIKNISTHWYVHEPLPDLIIPIPLHYQRIRERGFNQALEIAKPISKRLKIPLDTNGIQRVRATHAQSSLKAPERMDNIKQAFYGNKNYTGLNIAIVDDVMTTGSTIREFCSLLNNLGAQRITIWCCARQG